MRASRVDDEFLLSPRLWNELSPVAYETLLLDAMRGDPTLFTRRDEVEAEWRSLRHRRRMGRFRHRSFPTTRRAAKVPARPITLLSRIATAGGRSNPIMMGLSDGRYQ